MSDSDITPAELRRLVAQVTARIEGRPLDAGLQAWLNEQIGPQSELYQQLKAACETGARAGWLCTQTNGRVRFSRIFEPAADLHGFSVDVVDMDDVAGRHHEHPTGEIDLVMPQEGDARFDGHSAGWVVYGPGTAHSPTTTGGRLLVMYLLPQGQIRFT